MEKHEGKDIFIRGFNRELYLKVRIYAAAKGLPTWKAIEQLIVIGLRVQGVRPQEDSSGFDIFVLPKAKGGQDAASVLGKEQGLQGNKT